MIAESKSERFVSFMDKVDKLLAESRELSSYSRELLQDVRRINARDWRADHALPERAL
jgi:5'-deoxynucleotidase YfbR-like HD superfamily hydrolase